ncbi:hypothetical protein ARMSODRAFT_953292 [Armillaria solidipes]|uniref:Uncharacterized protein n=1 Tax=Armillaria solidipes TaxID=1076256 RepID=A0A2H3BPQ1_9AGAR|nr:hypothetical protein ARMSODRAFT_953292 [Armillaria solidipes]
MPPARTNKLNIVLTDDRYSAVSSPVSVLFNDDAWCCIIECRCSLKRRPHIRRRFGRRIIRRLPKVPVQTAAAAPVVRRLPVPPSERKIRKLPAPPPSRSADTRVKPRTLPTPPPKSTIRRLPTPPPLKPRSVTQPRKVPGRPLPLVSFPTTPSVTCSTPMLMQSMSSRASAGGHADEMLLSPLIDWDVVMEEIIYRNSNASSTVPDAKKARREEVVFHGKNGSWMRASFTRTL